MRMAARRSLGRRSTGIATIVCVLLSICALFPFFWMVVSSMKYDDELYRDPPTLIPQNPTLVKYGEALSRGGFGRYMLNSLFVTGIATAVSVVLATLGGYAFARLDVPGGKALLFGILLTYTFPGILILIPFYFVFRSLGLIDTHLALVIVYVTFTLPYAIWTMRNYFLQLPESVEECAMVDGCTRMRALWKVILPMARPAIAACFIYCFVSGWNEFMFANTIVTKESLRTLPIGLNAIMGEFTTDWGLLMAGSVISTVPMMALFSLIQTNLVEGLSAGAVKG